MSQQKDNAMVLAMLLLGLVLHGSPAHSAYYTVGDDAGWTFGVSGWENDKNFTAGDNLVFKYNPKFHNVVLVDKSDYDSCTVPTNTRRYNSGNDTIYLASDIYYICGFPGHCQRGMKLAPNVTITE